MPEQTKGSHKHKATGDAHCKKKGSVLQVLSPLYPRTGHKYGNSLTCLAAVGCFQLFELIVSLMETPGRHVMKVSSYLIIGYVAVGVFGALSLSIYLSFFFGKNSFAEVHKLTKRLFYDLTKQCGDTCKYLLASSMQAVIYIAYLATVVRFATKTEIDDYDGAANHSAAQDTHFGLQFKNTQLFQIITLLPCFVLCISAMKTSMAFHANPELLIPTTLVVRKSRTSKATERESESEGSESDEEGTPLMDVVPV